MVPSLKPIVVLVLLVYEAVLVFGQQTDLPGQEKRFITSEQRYELEEAEAPLASGDEVLHFDPVVCIVKTLVPLGRMPDVRTRMMHSVACTKAGKPWVMFYMELRGAGLEEKKRPPISRRVLLDLENEQWIMHTSRWGDEDVVHAVEEYIDQCPNCWNTWLFQYLAGHGLLREIWSWETDQLKIADFDLELRGGVTPEEVEQQFKSWFEENVVEVLRERQPELLATLQEFSDAVAGAEDPEGADCSVGLGGLLELMIPHERLKVVRKCESQSASYGKGEKSPWEDFWDRFSKWDTWPQFPNMKHFRF